MGTKNIHAVVGTGSAPDKVIYEGLKDVVKPGDALAVIWEGKPSQTMEVVYDFITDDEVEFVMFYEDGTTPPRIFREAEHGVVQKVRNPFKSAIQSVEGKGKILFLWDEEDEDIQIEPVFDYKGEGVLVLELTNGLAPITDEVDIPEPTDPVVEQDEATADPEDDTTFTKEELEIMSAPAVKRYGIRLGCKAATKGGIIAELFPEVAQEETGTDEVDPTEEEDEPDDGGLQPPRTTPIVTLSAGADEERFMRSLTNIKPSDEVIAAIEQLRESAKHYASAIFSLAPLSRERSLALTDLEESVMWAVKSMVLSDLSGD